MLRKTVVILAILLSSLATQVLALGLGTVTVESALNQPLRVRIEIVQLGDTRLQDVSVQIASLDDFQRFNIERIGFLSEIRFSIAASADGNFVTLTSNQIVREPYLSFILDTRWPSGRLLSEHTILLDLPVFETQQPISNVRQPISPVLQPPSASGRADVSAPVAPAPEPVVTPPVAPSVSPPAAVASEPETIVTDPEPSPEPEVVEPAAVATQTEPAVEETAPQATSPVVEPDVELAAEPAPEPETAPAAPSEIETNENDTLSDVALRVRPDDSVTVQQTMLAIQRLNPDAFIDGNMNRMRSGQVLRIPELSAIQSVDPREAIAEIDRQNQDFANVDVQPLAPPAVQSPDQASNQQGQLSVVTDGGAIDASSGIGELEAAENAELDQRIAELENALAVQQEEADRARIQREELDLRLDELEEQIAAAQEIIRLQDIQLAQLQDSLAEAAAEQAAQQAAIAEAEAQAIAQTEDRTSLVGDILRVITGNILFVGFGLVLVILLLVFLLLRRNRARQRESELDALDGEDFAPKDTRSDEAGEQEFEDYGDSSLDEELDQIVGVDTDRNALTQAAALLGKGNTDRAIAILHAALKESPKDQQLRMKLLEAFALQGDLSAFEEQADIIGDNSDLAPQINNLRRSIRVGEPAPVARMETKPKSAPFGKKPSSDEDDRLGAASFLDDLGIDLDAFDIEDDEPSVTQRSTKPAPVVAAKPLEPAPKPPAPTPAPSADDDSLFLDDMDLTFDLVGDEEEVAPASAPSASVKSPQAAPAQADQAFAKFDTSGDMAAVDKAGSIEFDVDEVPSGNASKVGASKDADELDIEAFEFTVDEQPVRKTESAEPELELETFEFDTTGLDVGKAAEQKKEAIADSENLLDFDFDKVEIQTENTEIVADDLEAFEFDTAQPGLEKPVSSDTKAAVADTESSLDFDFDEPEMEAHETDIVADDLETLEFDVDENPAATIVEKPQFEKPDDALDIDVADFELDDDELHVQATTEASQNVESENVEIDFDFDDEEPDTKPATIARSALDDELEDLDFLSDEDVEIDSVSIESTLSDPDEVATKLELAYAYRKMGDLEGAREILEEVLKEGNTEQIKQANDQLSALKND